MTLLLAQTLPPPDAIRQTAQEVVSRNYYVLEASQSDSPPISLRIIRWLLKPFEWLFESMEGWPDFVRWTIVIVMLVLLVALIAHIVYTFAKAIRGPAVRRQRPYTSMHLEVNPSTLEEEAERASGRGDYIGAIRLLFRAALRRIEVAEKKKLRPGSTNRELLQRYRSTPLFMPLERFVETIDHKWYGGGTCVEEDYLSCRGEHARILKHVEESRFAVGA